MSDQTQTPTQAPTDILTDHAYDGIQEFDNPTPSWWTWIFVLTVIFSIIYFLFVTLAGGQLSPMGFYERSVTADLERQFSQIGKLTPDAPTILKYSKDDKWLKVGASIFANNCVSCHGSEGQGLSGPNLTDEFYINVKKIQDIADVVANGRNNNAMPAWRTRMSPNEVVLVSSYVASMRGKNKPSQYTGAKGEAIAPWSE